MANCCPAPSCPRRRPGCCDDAARPAGCTQIWQKCLLHASCTRRSLSPSLRQPRPAGKTPTLAGSVNERERERAGSVRTPVCVVVRDRTRPWVGGFGRPCGLVGYWVWMVVRFVCVIRVIRVPVCPVCVPAPPSVFLPLPVDARLSPPVHQSFIRHEAATVYTVHVQSSARVE